jgi:hypothetical protein
VIRPTTLHGVLAQFGVPTAKRADWMGPTNCEREMAEHIVMLTRQLFTMNSETVHNEYLIDDVRERLFVAMGGKPPEQATPGLLELTEQIIKRASAKDDA